MRKPLVSLGALVFLATCLVSLFAVTLSGHQEEFRAGRVAILTDWTTDHVLYPLYGEADRMALAQRDPRAIFSWLRHSPNAPRPRPRPPFGSSRGFHRDWSINLGAAGTAANMYPAKFTFDIAATPSCADDYIVYPVNTAGSASQANLVAFNNLYSGTGAGGTGSCNRTPTTDDDGVDATVLWSYNVNAVGGAVTTSPVLSWDVAGASPSVLGTKVAFVESAGPGTVAHFHVLAWRAGDGQDTTDPDGLQNTLMPAQITSFVATDPAAGSGTATDLALETTDTLSAPYVDYTNDYAYVGDDEGNLYRIKDVFCPSYNTDAGCTAGLAPSLDASWGTDGIVLVGGGCGVLTGAVDDSVTGDVFVGCSDGRIYGFTSSGATLTPSHFITLGDGSTFGGIVVPPIVDSSNGLVYAVTGTNGTTPTIMQIAIGDFNNNLKKEAALGSPPGENISIPTFNTAYFSSATSSNWAIFSCGYDSTGSLTELYDVGFNSSRAMDTGTPPPSNEFELTASVEACSPLTGFTNVPGTGSPGETTDWLFAGLSGGSLSNYNITDTTGSGFPGGFASTATVPVSGGASGIIPDNESSLAQASSIYFTGLASETCGAGGTGYCAIKLTQAGLD